MGVTHEASEARVSQQKQRIKPVIFQISLTVMQIRSGKALWRIPDFRLNAQIAGRFAIHSELIKG